MYMSACAGLDVHHDNDTNTVMVSFDLPGLQKENVEIEMCTTTY
jgi:HSP20 family molecular chaperone IbpA